MSKSVYSVVLSDEIVAEIDTLATREGFTRSAFINHILAEYASMCTPRKIMRETIMVIGESAQRIGLRSNVSSGGNLTLRTAIRYKYNPSLQYAVELFEGRDDLGELRVSVRSQNETLLTYMQYFFKLWARLEEVYLPLAKEEELQFIEPKRYVRRLRHISGLETQEETGQAVAAYISLLDECIKTYFNNLEDAEQALKATENEYRKGLAHLGPAKGL